MVRTRVSTTSTREHLRMCLKSKFRVEQRKGHGMASKRIGGSGTEIAQETTSGRASRTSVRISRAMGWRNAECAMARDAHGLGTVSFPATLGAVPAPKTRQT